ncbi:hypothetical protein [Streptomyces sp. 769]|uniref:hypothetical protein n=1 Tax=Streptomyces sp. 769 TaxID=1262452 RepID=UPI0013923002|nr:hypothetical protein [Streptomyces sp. 769]
MDDTWGGDRGRLEVYAIGKYCKVQEKLRIALIKHAVMARQRGRCVVKPVPVERDRPGTGASVVGAAARVP